MGKKIAFSGSSGAGKTTLVEYISGLSGIKHISGSSGQLKTEGDKLFVSRMGYPGGGHSGVIRYSALNPEYGIANQKLLQLRRAQMIADNEEFITDRSPIDNFAYFVNQVGYHPMVDDIMTESFLGDCLAAWENLDYVVFVKAVQPREVERNGSRVANRYYQKAIDAQFEYWLKFFQETSMDGPEVLIIDYWDLDQRKEAVINFLGLENEIPNAGSGSN